MFSGQTKRSVSHGRSAPKRTPKLISFGRIGPVPFQFLFLAVYTPDLLGKSAAPHQGLRCYTLVALLPAQMLQYTSDQVAVRVRASRPINFRPGQLMANQARGSKFLSQHGFGACIVQLKLSASASSPAARCSCTQLQRDLDKLYVIHQLHGVCGAAAMVVR